MAARPRGGDWLRDDLHEWKQQGVTVFVSLLTAQEQEELDLVNEPAVAAGLSLSFRSYPIADRDVPESKSGFLAFIRDLDQMLDRGQKILVHCRQGIGRSGLVAASLLMKHRIKPETAIAVVTQARGLPVPETAEQRRWLESIEFSLLLRPNSPGIRTEAAKR